MKSDDDRSAEDQFAVAWREWLGRPVKKAPHQAAAAISSIVRERRPAGLPVWVPVAATAALALAIGVWLIRPLPQTPALPEPAPVQAATPLGDDEMLMWLDESTPLYMTFQTPDSKSPAGERQ